MQHTWTDRKTANNLTQQTKSGDEIFTRANQFKGVESRVAGAGVYSMRLPEWSTGFWNKGCTARDARLKQPIKRQLIWSSNNPPAKAGKQIRKTTGNFSCYFFFWVFAVLETYTQGITCSFICWDELFLMSTRSWDWTAVCKRMRRKTQTARPSNTQVKAKYNALIANLFDLGTWKIYLRDLLHSFIGWDEVTLMKSWRL